MELLKTYDWPGNIRELQNIIERGVVLSQGATLALDSDLFAVPLLSATGSQPIEPPAAKPAPAASAPAALGSLEEVERNHILAALEESGGMVEGPRGAAGILKLHPNTLRSRMLKLGIKRSGQKSA
jgi:formate hydrogenlyase transcriptional activator